MASNLTTSASEEQGHEFSWLGMLFSHISEIVLTQGERPSTALALSGGGNRAAVFHCGVLHYLVDVGLNRSVTSITSVSGGCFLGALLAQELNLRTATPHTIVSKVVGRFAGFIARESPTAVLKWTYPYAIGFLILTACAVIPQVTNITWWIRWPITFVFLWAASKWISFRTRVGELSMIHHLLHKPNALDTPTMMNDVAGDHDKEPDYIFLATELQSGEPFYISPHWIYSPKFGVSPVPADFSLARGVMASCASTGLYSAIYLPSKQFKFTSPKPLNAPMPDTLILVDGGVYNILGEEWGLGYAERAATWPGIEQQAHKPERMIVVNCSAPKSFEQYKPHWFEVINELYTLARTVDVMYASSSLPRQRMLRQITPSTSKEVSLNIPTTKIEIHQSPYTFARAILHGDYPAITDEMKDRAKHVLAIMEESGQSEQWWANLTAKNSYYPTVIDPIPAEVVGNLYFHDSPLLEIPSIDRFHKIVHDYSAQ